MPEIRMNYNCAAMKKVLGIDGGSTKTEWAFFEANEPVLEVIREGTLPAANYKSMSPEKLREMFNRLPKTATHVGVYLAGCATEEEHQELQSIAAEIWPEATITAGSDRSSALATAFHGENGIAVISGTGSGVHGCVDGRVEKAGGWGQLLGDRGSGYDLSMQGLRFCLKTFDLERRVVPLGYSVLAELGLNRFEDLVDWCSNATKTAVAKLTPVIFAHSGDSEIAAILDLAAQRLAEYTMAVARRLELPHPQVRLLGGVFKYNPIYVEKFAKRLHPFIRRDNIRVCGESASRGAAWLALQAKGELRVVRQHQVPEQRRQIGEAVTEQSNPRSKDLDLMPLAQLVKLFTDEEEIVMKALQAREGELVRAIELIVPALERGGHLFYIGAGTSGRLGVLDASEIPPTFGASPELIQGIIAGGFPALHRAVEGAEDRVGEGEVTIEHRGIDQRDVVCGLTASGRTPFVLSALRAARKRGARTILITCNPNRARSGDPWDVEIDLPTGPELVTGSTRLKAGTATKLALNILSTCTMIRLGHVRGNRMIDLKASNVKLRDRAARIISESCGIDYDRAEDELERDDWNVRRCLDRLRRIDDS